MKFNDEEIYFLPYEKAANKRLLYSPIRGFVDLIEQENDNPDNVLEAWKETPMKDLDRMQKGLPALNIDFSNGCNMRCVYCYAERGNGCLKYQSKENIDQIITAYFNYLKQQPDFKAKAVCQIIFSNDAEPTFVPDLLIYTVNRIKEKAVEYDVKPQFSMPTNGAFHPELCDFILDNFYGISLSFDGPEKIQNRHRPFADGRPSYERVFLNAKRLFHSTLKMGFNVVVTAYNLDCLRETVDYFEDNFPGASISFSPVSLSGRALKEDTRLRIDYSEYHSKLMEALYYARGKTIKIRDKTYSDYHNPRRHYCSSTARPNWNVNLQGKIYACMESKAEGMRIGFINLSTGELSLDEKRIQALRAFSVEQHDMCRDCFAKYLCVGGCKVKAVFQSKECDQIRLKCLYMINKAYEEEQLFKMGQALFRINHRR